MTERNCADCVHCVRRMGVRMCLSSFPLEEDENRAENCVMYTPRRSEQ